MRVYFTCGNPGYIAEDCRAGNRKDKQESTKTAMLPIWSALVAVGTCKKSDMWMVDSACTRHMSNIHVQFRDFQP